MSKKEMLILHIFLSSIFILLFNIFDLYKTKEIIVLIVYAYTLFFAYKLVSLTNSYMIFLYTFGLFNLSRMVLDILGHSKFGWATKFSNYYFSQEVVTKILYIFILALIFIHLGFLIAYEKNELKIIILRNDILIKISKILFLISTPMILIKLFMQFKLILSLGYLAYYTGVVKDISYPIYTYGSGTIMTLAFALFIISKPLKKEYLIYSSIFLLIKFVDSLKGARALFLTQLLFVIWLYFKLYDEKIKVFFLVKLFSVAFIFSQIIVSFREKKIFSFKLINEIYDFFFSQGVSYLVLGYSIDLKEKIPFKPYIFQGIFGFKEQSLETLNSSNSIADHLTYILDSNAYLKGEGIGSNFLAEAYLLGPILMIVAFAILGYFIFKFEKLSRNNIYFLNLSLYVIPNIFYLPRGSYFGLSGLIKYILVYTLATYIILKGINLWKKYQRKPIISG